MQHGFPVKRLAGILSISPNRQEMGSALDVSPDHLGGRIPNAHYSDKFTVFLIAAPRSAVFEDPVQSFAAIRFQFPAPISTRLDLFDSEGRLIRCLSDRCRHHAVG